MLSMSPDAVEAGPVLAQRPWSPLVQQIRALERAADKRVDALSAAHGALQSIQSEFASLARQAEAAAASAQFSVDTDSTVERIQKLAQRMHVLQQVRLLQGMTHRVWCLHCPCNNCRHETVEQDSICLSACFSPVWGPPQGLSAALHVEHPCRRIFLVCALCSHAALLPAVHCFTGFGLVLTIGTQRWFEVSCLLCSA